MGIGNKRKTVKYAAKKVTLHQFYNSTRSGRLKDIYNPLKEDDELTSKLRQSSCSVSKPKIMEQSGSKKASNSGASKSQSSEQKIRVREFAKSKA